MLAAGPALGQEANWPQRPIRIIVPTSPGGSPHIASRLLGEKMSGRLGQSVVVESMTTGGGVAGLQLVAKGPSDGYNLAMLTGGFATQAAILKGLPYDPIKDFVFITSVVRYPIVYSVPPDSPIKSFKDMIERARVNPNKVSYGIVGAGTLYHLLGKWIDNQAGVEMNAVPYRGTAPALQDVLGGRVDVLSDAPPAPSRASAAARCGRWRCPRPSAIRSCPTCRPWRRRLRHQVRVLARPCRGGRHAAAHRRSHQRRDSPRAGYARGEEMGQGFRRGPRALDAGGIPRASRARRPSVDGDRRPQQYRGAVGDSPVLGRTRLSGTSPNVRKIARR